MRLKDYQEGREAGLAFALHIAKEGGIKALEEEIKARNITGIRLNAKMRDLETTEAAESVKNLVMTTVLAMSLEVLMDEFDFGKSRLQRFAGRFNFKTDCMAGGYVTWADYIKDIQKRTGIGLEISLDDCTGRIFGIPEEEKKETKQEAKKKQQSKAKQKADRQPKGRGKQEQTKAKPKNGKQKK